MQRFQESLAKDTTGLDDERYQYFGLSLREIVHTFKWQTLVLLKAMLLQPKVLSICFTSKLAMLICTDALLRLKLRASLSSTILPPIPHPGPRKKPRGLRRSANEPLRREAEKA